MLTTTDVMAGKAVVQLGLATPEVVQAALIDLDRNGGACLTARLTEQGALNAEDAQRAQACAERYEEVWAEGIYLRQLEKATGMTARAVASLLAETETEGASLGAWLLREQSITPEQDAKIRAKQERRLKKEARRIVDRYRGERFEGVARPLVQAKRLDPAKFKISSLFRSRAMRELVSKARKQLKTRPPRPKPDPPAPKLDYEFDYDSAAATTPPPVASPPAVPTASAPPPPPAPVTPPPPVAAPAPPPAPAPLPAPAPVPVPAPLPASAPAAPPVVSAPAPTRPSTGRTAANGDDLGKNLRVLLTGAKAGGLPPDLARRVFVDLLKALIPTHATGHVHGDVCPENVFVRPRDMRVTLAPGDPQISAGGPADAWTRLKALGGDPRGSAAYTSPDVLGRGRVDARSDLYSLGVVLFELLSGRLPFIPSPPRVMAGQHWVAPPLRLSEAAPARLWPWALEDLCARLLSKVPDERPATAQDVLSELASSDVDPFSLIRAVAHSA